ncbi:hypothetical protein DYB31_016777 [Aphanomyces astaci]|uniref:Uncharacterized protein n=1 Tax=Aphanomyces astaci TaxID=112090 RepID=A0A397FMT9_APHAT|nr:hypothetical protein DYB31_016777 [Aphanomyces astaci]
MVDGWNHDFRLVLRTPGPAGKKYGIIDGQHGFMAIVDLWMDRTLGPGAALSSLMRQGQSNPCFPSIVVENASNLNVVQPGMRYNEMYKHGNNRKAFYWMTKFVLFHNWSTFAGCRLSNSFEYGERFGAQDPDALLCVEKMKRMKLDVTAMSRKTSIDTFRAATRLWYFDLFGAIIAELDDPFSNMELLGYKPWYTCMEVLQNYYVSFAWRPQHAKLGRLCLAFDLNTFSLFVTVVDTKMHTGSFLHTLI